jgi:hypothetical protein
MTTALSAISWTGWWRAGPQQPWHRLDGTEATTEKACWSRLLSLELHGDLTASSGDPNEREQRPRVPNEAKGHQHNRQSWSAP